MQCVGKEQSIPAINYFQCESVSPQPIRLDNFVEMILSLQSYHEKVGGCHFVEMGIIWGQKCGVERWPRSRGSLSTILNSDAVGTGTKVSVRHRQGGRSSEVVIKRGSTVNSVYYASIVKPSHCFSKVGLPIERL